MSGKSPAVASPGTWSFLMLHNQEQPDFVNVFKEYQKDTSSYTGDNLIERIRDDFTVADFTIIELLDNYEIYRRIKRFLYEHGVDVPDIVGEKNDNILLRVLHAIWYEEKYQPVINEAYRRYLDRRQVVKAAKKIGDDPTLYVGTPVGQPRMEDEDEQADNEAANNEEEEVEDPYVEVPPQRDQQVVGNIDVRKVRIRDDDYSDDSGSDDSDSWIPKRNGASGANRPFQNARSMKPSGTNAAEDYANISTKVQTRYKGEKQKFGGTMDENWTMALARYQRTARDLGMTVRQKVDFIHYIFRDDAEQFYYDELEQIQNWNELVAVLNERYNGDVRQQAIADEIRMMTLSDYVESDCDEGAALQKLARRIERLVPQNRQGKNRDEDKLEALYYAVRHYDWAQAVIHSLSISSGGGVGRRKTYKQFLSELEKAQQNHRISRRNAGRDKRSHRRSTRMRRDREREDSSSPTPRSSRKVAVWFAGQARYGRDPKAKKMTTLSDKKDRKCYNCGASDHIVSGCKKPIDDVRVIQGRVKNMTKGKSRESVVKALRKLLIEQASHVNFLSEELSNQIKLSDRGQSESNSSEEGSVSGSSSGSDENGRSEELFTRMREDAERACGSNDSSTRKRPSLANAIMSGNSSSGTEDFL